MVTLQPRLTYAARHLRNAELAECDSSNSPQVSDSPSFYVYIMLWMKQYGLLSDAETQ
jgi:hypothetical protein